MRSSIRTAVVVLAGIVSTACESTTQEDRFQHNHAVIRGTVRQSSGEVVPGAQLDFFGFEQRTCGSIGPTAVLLAQSTTNAQGEYQVKAQGSPIGRPIDVCVVVRARATIGSQLKEQTVSGPTVSFVAAEQVPDTVNVNVVLPP